MSEFFSHLFKKILGHSHSLHLNESYNRVLKVGGLYSVIAGFKSLLGAGHSAGSVS